jgi:hypothetical protein
MIDLFKHLAALLSYMISWWQRFAAIIQESTMLNLSTESWSKMAVFINHLAPGGIQLGLKLFGFLITLFRLIQILKWSIKSLGVWAKRQSNLDKDCVVQQKKPRFNYTNLEGILNEFEDSLEEWENQRKPKICILGLSAWKLVFGIFCPICVMVWQSLFEKERPNL